MVPPAAIAATGRPSLRCRGYHSHVWGRAPTGFARSIRERTRIPTPRVPAPRRRGRSRRDACAAPSRATCCSIARRAAAIRPMRRSTRSSRSACSFRAATPTCVRRSTSAASSACRCCRAGAGSSQCGQTVGAALVVDHSKHLNRVVAFDRDARTVTVEPGIVLDALNAWLRPHGLWFPVDVSTSAQCTLGGMTGNNSCGSRSIAYGNMVHNVLAIDATLADGTEARFGPERDMEPGNPAGSRASGTAAGARCARARRDRAAGAEGDAARRRLQHRPLLPAERAALHRGRQRQLCASARGQRGNARMDARGHAAPRAAAAAPRARRRQFSDAVQGDGYRAAHRSPRAVGGRARRPDDDRPRARQSRVPAGHRCAR